MNIFVWVFENLIYRPQLNLLQFFYDFTGDIGISIVLIATVVNLALWPLFITTYLNGQKIKVLQPKLKDIQTRYKDNQQELLKHTIEFNKKHGISNGSFLIVIIAQIFFASGLFYLTRDVSMGQIKIPLYQFFSSEQANFNNVAFGFLDIGMRARNFIWLPLLNLVFSYFYGLYTFKLAPKLDIESKTSQKPKDTTKKQGGFDSEAFQKSFEFQTLYVLPIFIFLFNFSFSVGVNIYFVTTSFLSLIRQVFVNRYYKDHTTKLIQDIAKTDPDFLDNNVIDVPNLAAEAVPTKTIKKTSVDLKNTKKKLNIKKKTKHSKSKVNPKRK
jgi:YidC/Oxa1 family membrane protein insertase